MSAGPSLPEHLMTEPSVYAKHEHADDSDRNDGQKAAACERRTPNRDILSIIVRFWVDRWKQTKGSSLQSFS